MKPVTLANANASVISVTSTATTLLSLLDTAGSTTHTNLGGLDAVDLYIEDGDIRLLYDGNTPTSSKGMFLKRGTHLRLRKIQLSLLKLISTSATPVAVDITVGYSEPGESTSADRVPYSHEALAGEDFTNDVLKVEERFTPQNITTATTTTVKTGAGFLHTLTVNLTAAGTITIYDNTAASGTKIATLKASIAEQTFIFDASFATGLTIVTAAASDITVSYR